MKRQLLLVILFLAALPVIPAVAQQHFRGDLAYDYARDFVAIGPRWCLGPGHVKAEAFLRNHFRHDNLEEDTFTANTAIGPVPMRNFIVRFPGRKNGIIVLATHYETNYPLRNIAFVGANDGGSTTGLLIEMANELRARMTGGKLDGDSVWLVFFDGEEAFQSWQGDDHTYGSRHLAAKWAQDGTLPRVQAFLLTDMLGDKDLDVMRDTTSTQWLSALVGQAARITGYSRYFYKLQGAESDDHDPFLERNVPAVDIIDSDYGPQTVAQPDGYHHTAQDTMDKISAHSLTIAGDVLLESIHLLNQR